MQDKTTSYLPIHSKMTLLLTLSFGSLKDLFGIYNNQLEVYILDAISFSWKSQSSGRITPLFIEPPKIN